MRSFLYMVFLLSLTVSSNLTAQEPGDELDPLMGSYILGNSAEIIMQCAPTSGDQGWRIFDYNRDPAEITQEFSEVNSDSLLEIAGGKAMDITSGDLNGDMYDNIIAAWECANHSIAICIPEIIKDSLSWASSHITVIDSVLNKRIRLFTGDFDRDRQKEFVLAYHDLDGNVHISLYQTDSLLVLEKMAEIADSALGTSTLFDLTAGDFDYDGLDEIVLIQYIASDYIGNDHYRLRSNVKVYDYDAQGQIFIPHTTNEISVINNYDASLTVASHVPRLVIAAGNFDGDAQEEVAYGYEVDFTFIDLPHIPFRVATHFYNRVTNFNIDPSLNSVSYDENRKGEIDNWKITSGSGYFTAGFSTSIDCHDLNGDGIDEVIGYGSRYYAVFTVGENLSLNRVAQIRANSKYGYENCHHLLAVTDLDADTTSADSGKWVPEIVHIDFINDPASNINNPGQLRIRAHQPILDASGSITGITLRAELRTDIDGTYLPSCVIAPGDFDGDAVRLGKPRLFSREYVVQPTVILNAPPVHYDIISDTSYDVCFSYNENDPEFVSSYEFTNSADKQVETEVHGDWGISASLSAGGSFLGVGARTTLTTKYGEGFSKSELNRHTMVIEQKAYARVDDEIYATITDYSFWEYPVYFKGEHYGYVLAAIPYFKGNNWFPSKSWTGISHIPNHEVGNILSYPNYANVINNPELEQLLYDFGTCELHGTSENHMALTITEFTFISDQTSWDFGMSINSAVWGWGISLSTEAHYNKGEINTHKTSVSEQFEITIDLFDIDTEIGEVNYKVRPYAYRSQNGVIVIDYNVELPVAAPGDPVTWWQSNYSDYADPAFILPWLYDPEKGYTLEEEAKRHMTKEITFNPSPPQAGDTVMIKARIHNYSLMDTDSPVNVRFYQGDPDAGGTAIVSIYGETEVTTPSIIASQDVAYVEMYWAIPAEISEYTRIYAVIDPDNNITEIHENNNKGFVTLSLWGATSIEEVVPNEIPDQFTLYQNYPNPFNPSTKISYQLPKTSNVVISVYNIIGQKIATLVSNKQSAGIYQVEWDASDMASGVYLYRLEAEGYVETKKMILMR